jgi:hypothetical protein
MIKLNAGWLHAAINLEPTVSYMENFLSYSEMPLVSELVVQYKLSCPECVTNYYFAGVLQHRLDVALV